MKNYFFSFGSNHVTDKGISLGNCYVVIRAENENEAREQMVQARGLKWCTSYSTAEQIGVERYNLQEVPLEYVRIEGVSP